MTLTHQAVLYVGALAVRDNTAFLQAYKKGIGSGKAFGFGLLSLARA
jgi:CRISPR system Cascade subunit CasE